MCRPVEIGGVGGGGGGGGGAPPPPPPPRLLLTSLFDELKIILLKWKIVQNYKTSRNSSKFFNIYNILIDLDTRDDIL